MRISHVKLQACDGVVGVQRHINGQHIFHKNVSSFYFHVVRCKSAARHLHVPQTLLRVITVYLHGGIKGLLLYAAIHHSHILASICRHHQRHRLLHRQVLIVKHDAAHGQGSIPIIFNGESLLTGIRHRHSTEIH